MRLATIRRKSQQRKSQPTDALDRLQERTPFLVHMKVHSCTSFKHIVDALLHEWAHEERDLALLCAAVLNNESLLNDGRWIDV